MGLPFTAARCHFGDGLTRRDDVVSFDLLRGERQENSPVHYCLFCCSGCRQYGYNHPDYCPVRAEPIPDG